MPNGVPANERISIKDFPVRPGDIISAQSSYTSNAEKPRLGEVVAVYARQRESGYTIAFKSKEDMDGFLTGVHENTPLSQKDSMWALIVFATLDGPQAEIIHTYDLLEKFKNLEFMKVDPQDFFANHFNTMIHG